LTVLPGTTWRDNKDYGEILTQRTIMLTRGGIMSSQSIWATLLAVAVYLSTASSGKVPASQPTSPAVQNGAAKSTRTAIVSRQAVSLRKEMKSGAEVIGTLGKGIHLTIEDENKDAYKVRTEDGRVGWVAQWAVEPATFIPSKSSSGREVVGYYAEYNSTDTKAYASFAQNLDKITTVAPFSYRVDAHGNISGKHNTNLVKLAKSRGIQVLALVHNIENTNFSSKVINQMLSSSSARSRAINGIIRLAQEQGYSGVNIDFEGVPASNRTRLTTFFRELSAALRPKGLLVTASLPAKTREDKTSSWSGAYDYGAIAPYLDKVMIMAYDQHYQNSSPGPVASLDWLDKVIKYTLKHFPANRTLMGIAAYGYDWTNRSGRALNLNAINNLIKKHKITPKWHPTHQVPYFTYYESGTKHEVWYENRHSTATKLGLIDKYNLKGIAIWRLGYEDPGIWSAI
jgi:spore germination protein